MSLPLVWAFLCGPAVAYGAVLLGHRIYLTFLARRYRRERSLEWWTSNASFPVDVAATPPIPAAVRAELDQTPAWWDEQFHALLCETSAPRIDQSWARAMETRGAALLTREGVEE